MVVDETFILEVLPDFIVGDVLSNDSGVAPLAITSITITSDPLIGNGFLELLGS